MRKVGVVLSGCGVMDGSEIHEAVLALLAIDQSGAQAACFAPDMEQTLVVNHLTGQEVSERRNVLVEAARIARGRIRNLKDARARELDALILPGGWGAAKNLSDFAAKGAACSVDPDLARLIRAMAQAGKPIGAICISPGPLAKALQGARVLTLTPGRDEKIRRGLIGMGMKPRDCAVHQTVRDRANRVVSTPAYLQARRVSEAYRGIRALVKSVLRMVPQRKGRRARARRAAASRA